MKIWAGTMGVYAKPPASADDRLEEDSELRGLAIELLSTANHNLRCLLRSIDQTDEAISQHSDSSSGSSLSSTEDEDEEGIEKPSYLEKAIQHLRHVTDQLFSLLHLVRQPTALSSNQKVFSYNFQANFADDYEDLIDNFASSVRIHLWRTFRSAELGPSAFSHDTLASKCSLPATLVERLVSSAVLRRKALMLKLRHSRKLWSTTNENMPSLEQHGQKVIKLEGVDLTKPNIPVEPSSRVIDADSRYSQTVPSQLVQPQNQDSYGVSKMEFPRSSKSVVVQRAGLDIPAPPKIPIGETEFQCFICGHVLRREMAQTDFWR